MSSVVQQHRRQLAESIGCAVITISDTRTIDTDVGGRTIAELLDSHGHRTLLRTIVRDEPDEITAALAAARQLHGVQAVLFTGGTGINRRDQTFETISELIDKPIPGYGELFRMLSYEQVGAAAMLSRAIGGVSGTHVLLTMPGSPAAVRLAMEKLILPELGHLAREASR